MQMTLADGRTLEYVELGDPSGVPVVFQPGTPGTARSGAVVEDAAVAAGVRLIAVSRPGYGASSTTAPGLTPVATDTVELLDHLGMAEVGVFGVSGGGAYALAVAASAPDRVSRVVIGASGAPPHEVGVVWEVEQAAVAKVAAGDLDGGWALLVADAEKDFGDPTTMTAEQLAARIFPQPLPPDGFFGRHPALLAAFQADVHRAVQRFDGYVRDNLSWSGSWDFDLRGVAVPVLLIYGEQDVVVPPLHGEWLRDQLAAAELRIVAGGHGEATFGAATAAFAFLAGR